MKKTSLLATGITAICMALLCSGCVVHRDHPRPPHHKKHRHHKPPRHDRHHRHHADNGMNGGGSTYLAGQWYEADSHVC